MYEVQKKLTWSSLRIGLVVTIGLIFLFSAVFLTANITNFFSPRVSFSAVINNIQGLRIGAPVWLYGVEVGNVSAINLTTSGTVVSLSIDNNKFGFIHKDALAMIMTMGILGDKYIEISPGSSNEPYLTKGDTIIGQSTVGFEQITSAAYTTMAVLDSSVSKLQLLLSYFVEGNGSFKKFLEDPSFYNHLTSSLSELDDLINKIDTANGTMRMLVDDPTLYRNLNEAVEQFTAFFNRINYEVGDGNGVANALIQDSSLAKNLRETMGQLKTASQSLNDLIKDFKANPKKYFKLQIF